MKYCLACFSLGLSLIASVSAHAQFITIEPDAYTNWTVLDHIVPQVALTSVDANNLPIQPVPFPVTSQPAPSGLASTGTKVFAQAGVDFFNNNVRLRMNFDGVVQNLSLDAIGSGFMIKPERGHLEAYSADSLLLGSFVTDILARGQVQTMTLNRASPDIAWAVAWSEDGTFARFDHLDFSSPVAVPEPAALGLLGAGLVLAAVAAARRRQRCLR